MELLLSSCCMVYCNVNDAAGDEGRAYSTHGNTAVVHTFIVFTCERRWMYVEPAVLLSNVSKDLPQQAEVAQEVPGRLKPRIFLTFRHYKGVRSSAKRTGRL